MISMARSSVSTSSNRIVASGKVSAGAFFIFQPHPNEEMVREQRLHHRVVPPAPSPHFVVVHPHLALRFLEGRLDRPPHPAHSRQLVLPERLGRVRQKDLQRCFLTRASAKDRPRRRTGLAAPHRARHTHEGKLGLDRTLRAFLDRVTPPRPRRQVRSNRSHLTRLGGALGHAGILARPAHRPLPWGLDCNTSDPNPSRDRHPEEVPLPERFDPVEELQVGPIRSSASTHRNGTFRRSSSPCTIPSPSCGSVVKTRSSGTP